jgi:small-conductance mechanosensitive channel
MKVKSILLAAVVCLPCVDWTRLSGTVKAINLKASTITIQNRDGDLLTIPVNFEVSITEKHDERRTLKTVRLDEKITLLRVPADAPAEDTSGLAPPDSPQHGQ